MTRKRNQDDEVEKLIRRKKDENEALKKILSKLDEQQKQNRDLNINKNK